MSFPPRIVQTTFLIFGCALILGCPMPTTAQAESEAEPRADAEKTASADELVRKGRSAFNNTCRTCHSIREGDNRLGPSLHGIVGDKAGTEPGYAAYSAAMRSSGIVWDEQTLDRFIENPEAVVPNNNMKPFAGITNPQVRRQIIAYLKTLETPSASN